MSEGAAHGRLSPCAVLEFGRLDSPYILIRITDYVFATLLRSRLLFCSLECDIWHKKVNFVTGYLHLCTKIHPSDGTSTSDCMQQERDKVKLYVTQEYGMRENRKKEEKKSKILKLGRRQMTGNPMSVYDGSAGMPRTPPLFVLPPSRATAVRICGIRRAGPPCSGESVLRSASCRSGSSSAES
jgi:hypothetical protein